MKIAIRELPWTLDLVGEGPLLPQAQALAQALGLAERVRFLGARRDVAEVLAGVYEEILGSGFSLLR